MLDAVLREVWILYALATFIIFLRYIARIRTVGIKGLYWDDLFCLGVLVFNTLDASTWLETATPADIARLEYGSKLEYTAWCSYPALIWCMKFTMLFFYKRLTLGSFHTKFLTFLFWFTGLSYLAVWLTLIFGCFPTQMNWQVSPAPPWKCAFRPQNFLSVAILNILTDAAILCVPIPMLWQLKVPLRKKLTVGAVLCSGFLVIVAAIIRVVLSLDAAPSAANINGWGVRETFIGIFTINIPILRPLLSKAFWRPGPYNPAGALKGSTYVQSKAGTSTFRSAKARPSSKSSAVTEYELEGATFDRIDQKDGYETHSTGSQEQIIPTRSRNKYEDVDDRVIVEKSYAVRTTRRDEEMGSIGGAYNSLGVPR